MSYRTASGQPVTVGRRLGGGAEGDIFDVTSPRAMALKRYKQEALAKMPAAERKVRAMVASSPEWREARTGFVKLAWPLQVVLENGRFTGFLMAAVDTANSVELHRVANPSDRRVATGPEGWLRGFSWNYLVRTAANLAHVTDALHQSRTVVGDFNERNIFVTSQARVTLIDCDSMQVTALDGEPFFCRVGRMEFTPPELIGADWSRTFRHPSSDLFPLAIHVYQLLMEGEHPFRGIWSGSGDKPPVPLLARQGIWAHQPGGPLRPRPTAMDFGLLPGHMQEMFRAAFEGGAVSPSRRPAARDWLAALNRLAAGLRQCPARPGHFYPEHLTSCPWCPRGAPATAAIPRQGWSAARQRPRVFRRFPSP